MENLQLIAHWIGDKANKIAIALRAFFYMGSLLKWWELTAEQLMAIAVCCETFLAVFVEGNIISKVRAGERIREVRAETRERVRAEMQNDIPDQ